MNRWKKGILPVAALAFLTTARANPPYNGDDWNNDPCAQYCNNCYAWAVNQPGGLFAQPGGGVEITGDPKKDCPVLRTAAEHDGLIFAGETNINTSTCAPGCCRVALVTSNQDYHWYQENDNGTWSHKPGQFPVRNVDGLNKVITNPETANRNASGDWRLDPISMKLEFDPAGALAYKNFCAYYCVCPGKVHTDGPGPPNASPLFELSDARFEPAQVDCPSSGGLQVDVPTTIRITAKNTADRDISVLVSSSTTMVAENVGGVDTILAPRSLSVMPETVQAHSQADLVLSVPYLCSDTGNSPAAHVLFKETVTVSGSFACPSGRRCVIRQAPLTTVNAYTISFHGG